MRLPGSDEDQGTLRVGLADASGHTEGMYASAVNRVHLSHPCSFESLPPWADLTLRHMLDFPPPFGRVHPRVSSRSSPPTWSSSPLPSLAPFMAIPIALRASILLSAPPLAVSPLQFPSPPSPSSYRLFLLTLIPDLADPCYLPIAS